LDLPLKKQKIQSPHLVKSSCKEFILEGKGRRIFFTGKDKGFYAKKSWQRQKVGTEFASNYM
jgi:hypothetical protein